MSAMSSKLHAACRLDELDVIKLCVSHDNININAADSDGKTPLSIAIIWKCGSDTLRYLLEHGANVNKCNHTESALILACRIGNYQAAHMCIDAGCDVNLRTLDAKHETALHILLRKFHTLLHVGHSVRQEHFHAFSEQLVKVMSVCERLDECHHLHMDVPDVYGKTAADIIKKSGFLGKVASVSDEERFREVVLYPRLPHPLSCLAAQQCARNYYNCFLLPSKLQEFVTLHLKPSDIECSRSQYQLDKDSNRRTKLPFHTLWRNIARRLKL